MRKSSLALACALAAMTLGLSLSVAAQQGRRAQGAQARASLDASLDQLESLLKEGDWLDLRPQYPRRTYVRLKRSGGCEISFRVSRTPGSSLVRDQSQRTTDLSTDELSFKLSELDPAAVELQGSNADNATNVSFSTLGGKEAIRWKGFAEGQSGRIASGRIEVNKKVAPQVAEALRQAIAACRK